MNIDCELLKKYVLIKMSSTQNKYLLERKRTWWHERHRFLAINPFNGKPYKGYGRPMMIDSTFTRNRSSRLKKVELIATSDDLNEVMEKGIVDLL